MRNDLKILVVDDHPIHLTLMKQQLAKLPNTRVATEQTVASALSTLSDDHYDFVFCDLDMPHSDGIDLLISLNEQKYAGNVALISALDRPIISAVSAMCENFSFQVLGKISKPYSNNDIQQLLDNAANALKPARKLRRRIDVSDQEFLFDLANGRVKNYYQPLVDCRTGDVVGYEALARWLHPIHGMLSPAHFLPIVERCNLSHELFDIVTDNAIRDARYINQGQRISINADQINIEDGNFSERFIAKCLENRVEPSVFTIEITENTSFSNSVALYKNLAKLRLNGVNVSIDDFGTGHSSLEKLSLLPFNELKIDRSFVSEMEIDSKKQKIVNSICGLAKSLNLKIVAEGVEKQSTWNMLKKYNIDVCQGYLFNKPMPIEAINILSA
ncbi:EAL domain-containing response regulator [Vibrio vulnificus]|uniref:EAL domain-containing response regulator n=1 Tax=Vibrio vulnificus TaxID=672 RepID=UPI001CDC4AFD|nr:EAL domain-containing response regulator [Vibrio vulnificus]ELK8590043.1 EAL domain-containing response regulator [Vibrio vulnificus]ELK8590893.1 EAL domain-containing response regulator [Vibrio vulnificus]MCA3966056.1 EAL domain-containing response regulator [Vibrio vulnificus]MDS1804288.1 EAL domain-containing response regulator [Vibrio vulnificus]HDY7822055.1 EAL domain-containing response regulator [Vibrio vulnificus]